MALLDEVQLNIKAGRGGDGVVRWRQEKGKPLSGPGGGNGGTGGDVYALAVPDIGYLDFYRTKKVFQAAHGMPGANWGRKGPDGEELVLQFPVGTVLTNKETGESFLMEHPGQKTLILKGGRGGLGNEYFKSSRNTTPKECTPGKSGEYADFDVQLRLFADVGLVGIPSAGKSTLINALTHAKSKVAEYHFTTLDPHLGAFYEFIIADIPGLIEGASEGKGLGTKFLKHISRTKAIAHILSLDSEDLEKDYLTVKNELAQYDPELVQKNEIIIFTKSDSSDEKTLKAKLKTMAKHTKGKPSFVVSAFDDVSIKELSDGLVKFLRN